MKPPEVVRLDMKPSVDPETGARFCAVEVRDYREGRSIFFGGVKAVADWLKARGYVYLPGSNGVWALG